MSQNVLLDKLRAGEVALGVGLMYPAAGILECIAPAFDWTWIDGQHGEFSYDSVLQAVWVSAAIRVASVVRVPSHEFGILGRYADTCPAGIMIPMVNDAEQAKNVASALRLAPAGSRSYGGRRVVDLGGRMYYKEQELIVIAQVETMESVRNAPAVIATPGIDVLFFGPDDMKTQLGLPINTPITESKELREGMAKTAKAAKEAGKFSGCVAGTPAALQMAVDMGYQLIVGGGDILFLREGSAKKIEELRNALKTRQSAREAPSTGIYGG